MIIREMKQKRDFLHCQGRFELKKIYVPLQSLKHIEVVVVICTTKLTLDKDNAHFVMNSTTLNRCVLERKKKKHKTKLKLGII